MTCSTISPCAFLERRDTALASGPIGPLDGFEEIEDSGGKPVMAGVKFFVAVHESQNDSESISREAA